MDGGDPGFWKEATGWVAAAAGTLIALVWTDNKREIREMRAAMVTEATLETHLRQDAQTHAEIKLEQLNLREDIREIFKLLRNQETSGHDRHVELLNAINDGDNRK